MPEINIDSQSFFSGSELFSVMLFPNSKEQRDHYKADYASRLQDERPELSVDEMAKTEGPEGKYTDEKWKHLAKEFYEEAVAELSGMFVASGGRRTLRTSKSSDELKRDVGVSAHKGNLTGIVLNWVWSIEVHQPGGGSLKKAFHLIESLLGPKLKGLDKPFGARYMERAWAEYRSVSHLWAAMLFWNWLGKPDKLNPNHSTKNLVFLLLAEKYREFGINHMPHSRKGALLASSEMWFPPKNFNIPGLKIQHPEQLLTDPEGVGHYNLKLPYPPPIPLGEEAISALKEYRAPVNIN